MPKTNTQTEENNTELTATGIMLRADSEDKRKLIESLIDENPIGKTLKLRITDLQNRFSLGKFIVEIKEWQADDPTPRA